MAMAAWHFYSFNHSQTVMSLANLVLLLTKEQG